MESYKIKRSKTSLLDNCAIRQKWTFITNKILSKTKFKLWIIDFIQNFSMSNSWVIQWRIFGLVHHPKAMITSSIVTHQNRRYQNRNVFRIGTKRCWTMGMRRALCTVIETYSIKLEFCLKICFGNLAN